MLNDSALLLDFQGTEKKKILAQTLLLYIMKNNILSNMQLDKLYRHHCKRETQSILFPPPNTNTLTAYRITELGGISINHLLFSCFDLLYFCHF